ncbi:unnamed protein product [Didymodactylos carnosus]|uniref:3'-5' exonuclease domain-containing protein n=1 Tax=Didymodactylos carnosus TaxID=1234261 RepID=A0A814E011_9BILA|nr:unnamed protein product [Didymodactylos carnosus]CAF3735841.1 unnamed protein product [Didymodactylos carnosus]
MRRCSNRMDQNDGVIVKLSRDATFRNSVMMTEVALSPSTILEQVDESYKCGNYSKSKIFQLDNEHLIQIIRNQLLSNNDYDNAVKLITHFLLQDYFYINELLLPLFLNDIQDLMEKHLIGSKQYVHQAYLTGLFMINVYQVPADVIPKLDKNEIRLMIIRCYDLYCTKENASQYPNLSILQPKRTLTYLINVKYGTNMANKTIMSDDCWNEHISELVQTNPSLSITLIERLCDKDDINAVKYWMTVLEKPNYSLPQWVQKFIHNKNYDQIRKSQPQKSIISSTNYYQLSLSENKIYFVDNNVMYTRLLDKLWSSSSEQIISIDCEWKPVFDSNSTTFQRISIMQLAFEDEIYILDLLYYFHTIDEEELLKRFVNKLFNSNSITLLAIKMKSDILPHLRLVNTRDKGLNKLLKACFGQQLYKGEQCSNWEQRPLRKAQVIYASKLKIFHK